MRGITHAGRIARGKGGTRQPRCGCELLILPNEGANFHLRAGGCWSLRFFNVGTRGSLVGFFPSPASALVIQLPFGCR